MTLKLSPWGRGSRWGVPLGALYLRSRSEPFGEESERKAPGGGPLSWGDTEVKHFPGEEGAPHNTPTHPPLQPAAGSSILQRVGGEELVLGGTRDRERPQQPRPAAARGQRQ